MQPPFDDRPVPLHRADACADAETLAALMDGTLSLDQVDERELDRLVSRLGPEALLWSIAEAPRLSPPADHHRDRAQDAARSRPRTRRMPLAAAAAVLVITAAGAVYLSTLSTSVGRPAVGSAPLPAATEPPPRPLRMVANPIILTAHREASAPAPPQFRAPAPDSRPPRLLGSIAAVADGEIRVDLGALDGLEKGAALDVFRQAGDSMPVGTLTVTRVFREYATGQATPAGALRVGDAATVGATFHVTALLGRAQRFLETGDVDQARNEAQKALSIAQSNGMAAAWRWRAHVQVATIERRAGNVETAERSFQAASEIADRLPSHMRPDAADGLNELGVLLIAREAYVEADLVLTRARSAASGAVAVRATNNSAAVAALRGDLTAAEALYREALGLAAASGGLALERRTIEMNLQAIGAVP